MEQSTANGTWLSILMTYNDIADKKTIWGIDEVGHFTGMFMKSLVHDNSQADINCI